MEAHSVRDKKKTDNTSGCGDDVDDERELSCLLNFGRVRTRASKKDPVSV